MTKMANRTFFAFAFLLCLIGSSVQAVAQDGAEEEARPNREVAVTFDHIPTTGGSSDEARRQITEKLLRIISDYDMPITGFVVGRQVENEFRRALLKKWLDEGMQLANHTYSHPSFFTASLAEYKEEIQRTEEAVQPVLAPRGERMRFFRYPYLNVGGSLEKREDFKRFLARHGYRVAPTTIDNNDFLFNKAYEKVAARGDSTLMRRIGQSYVEYTERIFTSYERLTERFLGRRIPQVFLLHAYPINADYFDEITEMMQTRGYSFISLPEALEDPAYDLPDRYTTDHRIRGLPSAIQRWRVTAGQERAETPKAPEWVSEIAYPQQK